MVGRTLSFLTTPARDYSLDGGGRTTAIAAAGLSGSLAASMLAVDSSGSAVGAGAGRAAIVCKMACHCAACFLLLCAERNNPPSTITITTRMTSVLMVASGFSRRRLACGLRGVTRFLAAVRFFAMSWSSLDGVAKARHCTSVSHQHAFSIQTDPGGQIVPAEYRQAESLRKTLADSHI